MFIKLKYLVYQTKYQFFEVPQNIYHHYTNIRDYRKYLYTYYNYTILTVYSYMHIQDI